MLLNHKLQGGKNFSKIHGKNRCSPHDNLASNIVRLEASKKVLLVHVPQGAAKLQAVKLF